MADPIIAQVQSRYASVAASDLSGNHHGVRAVAEAFGYTPEELAAIPAEANMGLSCGNPTAFAHLRPGETIVDLGCGGGLDVLLATSRVGPSGRAIGIDMTAEMIDRARRNAARPINGQMLTNVEFYQATLDRLPLAEGRVDCIISNCVINLVPDKRVVFGEMFRVLKPGGRLAISDIALKKPLPEDLLQSVMAYVGCIAGALMVEEYERGLRRAGFEAVQVMDTRKDLNVYAQVDNQSACCSLPMTSSTGVPAAPCCGDAAQVHQGLAELMRRYDINEYAASVQVYALKGSV
jgi:SAM-dependent methyltransferase